MSGKSNDDEVRRATFDLAALTAGLLRVIVAVTILGAMFPSLLGSVPEARAGLAGSVGSNGQDARPFYIFGHNPNTVDEVSGDLAAGANALEPDVMRFPNDAIYPGGIINDHAGDSGLFMYHDPDFATRRPTTVEDWLDHVREQVAPRDGRRPANVAMIVFDIKSAAAKSDLGAKLLQAVRTHLNHDGVNVNVIFSVATFSDDTHVFDQIIPNLGPREGVMIDAENDPGAVYNYLVGQGAAGHIGYGNGSIGFRYGLAPNVLNSVEAASWMRAGQVPALSIPYAYPMDLASDMQALITAGADGLIPDFDSPVATASDTQDHIRILENIVNGRDDVYLATTAEDPFHPRVEAYALQVTTKDEDGAGTDSNLTFTLTGCNGTSSVTIDSSYINHMEAGDVNYVTLPSKDLGALQSLTLSSDGSRGGLFDNSPWAPGRVEISSVGWGIPYGDHRGVDFSGTVDGGEQVRALGGWGHRCDPGIAPFGAAISTTEGVGYSGLVASFTDRDPAASASEYEATIDWDDGTTSSGTVSGPTGGTFTVTGAHTYAEERTSPYNSSVSILDTETDVVHRIANPQTVYFGATVLDAPLTSAAVRVAATEGAAFDGVVATLSDANPQATASDFAVSIGWGDGSAPSAGTVTDLPLAIRLRHPEWNPFVVRGTHTYAEEGRYAVTAVVVDVGGATTTASGTAATVADGALAATGRTVHATNPLTNVALAGFTDADPGGTVSDYHVTVDWGDGSPTSDGTVSGPDGGPFTVAGSHTYPSTGPFDFAVKVHICDGDGDLRGPPAIGATDRTEAHGSCTEASTSINTGTNHTDSTEGAATGTGTGTDVSGGAATGTGTDVSGGAATGTGSRPASSGAVAGDSTTQLPITGAAIAKVGAVGMLLVAIGMLLLAIQSRRDGAPTRSSVSRSRW